MICSKIPAVMKKAKPELNIALIYFSATEVTQNIATVMRDRLVAQGTKAELFNVTAFSARQSPLLLDSFNGFIFGFPVFADFAPRVINDWLPTLDGRGKRSALFLTYGGRTTGYAHFHTALLLEKAGFDVLFTAEFLGRHSFNVSNWKILPDRPGETDFAVARKYADLARKKFSQKRPPVLHLQKPFKYRQVMEMLAKQPGDTERHWTNPVRTPETCSMCRRCETECPAAAFNADSGLSDPVSCIECMHCVYICPDKVLATDPRLSDYRQHFLADWHLTDEMMNAKQSRIITDFRQAAC